MPRHLLTALLILLTAVATVQADEFDAKREKLDDSGFASIFDGKTLKGWHVSAQSGHSRKSKNKSGGRWVVEDGAIVGSQDIPGNGGIIITDKQYGDFEVIVEMRNDYGPDSGLFLRSTERGVAYQYLVDYHKDGSLAGLYGEGFRRGFHERNYAFGDKPSIITEVANEKNPLPITPEQWPKFWKHGEWNTFRARIEGNPPKITTWINGVRFMEWQDPATEPRHPGEGVIALQVHGGGDHTKEFVRYRGIKVKELKSR